MPGIRDNAEFEFPPHLQRWYPAGTMDHFTFHSERCKAAPDRLKLAEIQRMTDCDMCPDGGRGGPSGPRCWCALCREHFPEKENNDGPR
jgi:hypothetical protein